MEDHAACAAGGEPDRLPGVVGAGLRRAGDCRFRCRVAAAPRDEYQNGEDRQCNEVFFSFGLIEKPASSFLKPKLPSDSTLKFAKKIS